MSNRPTASWTSLVAMLFALLVLVGLGAGAIALEKPVGQATGRVLSDTTGLPLAGAKITVTGPVTRHMLTRDDGTFRFSNLPVGSYYISAKGHRFDSQFQENGVTIKEGQAVEHLDFKLVRTQPTLEITNAQRVFTPKEPVRILARGTTAPAIDVALYKLDLARVMALDPELKLLHQPKIDALIARGLVSPVKQWRQAIPANATDDDDWFFKPVQVETGEGAYVAALSTQPEKGPEDAKAPDKLVASYWFNVSRLGLVAKRGQDQVLLYGVDLVTKKPLPGIDISLFPGGAKGKTNADGVLMVPTTAVEKLRVLGRVGESAAVVAATWDKSRDPFRIYGYTDRPVYRPGQRVYFKATVRAQAPKGYGSASGKQVDAKLKDATGTEVGAVVTQVSEAGGLDGQFELAADASLGEYRLELAAGDSFESINFKVADYRKPEYKVDITPEKPRYVQGGTATVHVLSTYYFGAPVPNAKLAVSVYSAPAYDNYNPEEGFYYGYNGEDQDPVWGFGDVLQQTEGATDAQGKFDLSVPLAAAAKEKAGDDPTWTGDRILTVAVEAIDASGRPVKGHQSFRVSQGDFKLSAQPDQYLNVGKAPIGLSLRTRDYEDKPVATEVAVAVDRLEQVKETSKEGDETWKTVRVPAWKGTAKTDARGLAHVDVPAQPAGDYDVNLQATDAAGRTIHASTSAWVASEDTPFAGEPATRSGALKIVLDKKVYKPGDTARALVVSPVANVTALVTVEGQRLHEVHVVHIQGNTGLVTIPVTAAYEPNAYVAAAVVNGKEFMETSRSLNVKPLDKFLQVSVSSDKPRYEPGDQAVYTVETKDWLGKPVAAEVTLGVVDQAIYAIEPDGTPDIRSYFHGPRWNTINTSYSFAEDYSGGLDKFAPDTRVRAKFEDTAAWLPKLMTGADGKATATITLPDNLTTWVATAHAATTDTRVGAAQSTMVATKKLLVRLETPRFLVEGDHAVISAIAHSYLDQVQQVTLTLGLGGLTTTQPPTQLAALSPGDAKRVAWEVDVPAAGLVGATVSATSAQAADAMRLDFPALPYGTPEFQGFAGEVDPTKPGFASFDLPAAFIPGTTKLNIKLHASPLDAILPAIDYLHKYEYGCVEQTMTRFLPDVALVPRLDAANAAYGSRFVDRNKRMTEGLRRLAGMQHSDGGWGWWEHDETQLEMTSYVMYGLAEAKAAGFPPNATMVKRGLDHLQRALPKIGKDLYTRNSVRRDAGADARAFALFAQAHWDAAKATEIDRLWAERDGLSNYGLAQTAYTLAKLNDQRRFEALEMLRKRADDTASGFVHWNADTREFAWQDNATETTAYALRAVLLIAPDDALVVKAVRWLESKNARGYWDSTKDTGAAAIALADFMKVRRPAEPAQLETTVTLNGTAIQPGTTAFDAPTHWAVPDGLLKPGKNDLQVSSNGALDFSGGIHYALRADQATASSSPGVGVSREYYALPVEVYAKAKGHGSWGEFYDEKVVKKLSKLGPTVKAGERVLVKVTLTADRPLRYMALEDPLPAGCEILEDQPTNWSYWWDHQEYRDDKAVFFFKSFAKGSQSMYYVMRPTTQGRFRVLPTTAWAMYAPDVRARGAGGQLTITE
ncbi:MAG: alpha-2-macroglobulin family protein [Cyanobacteria bacterium RYN_339]|nr:alpha-2-macroglobulin family protein [Cyanobacteria bacterium RYN_339]